MGRRDGDGWSFDIKSKLKPDIFNDEKKFVNKNVCLC